MPLVCLGLSHHTAPVEVRERHAFPVSRMAETLIALRDYEAVREAVMLATCGRLEIYAELEEYETGVEQLKAFLRNFRHGAVEYDLSAYLYTLPGTQAAEHLFPCGHGLGLDADRRGGNPRPSQRRLHPSPESPLARQDAARTFPRGAQSGQDGARANLHRKRIRQHFHRCGSLRYATPRPIFRTSRCSSSARAKWGRSRPNG